MTRNPISTALNYISNNFFIRNLIIAISLGLVIVYLIGLGLKLYTRHGEKQMVPNFIGMTITEANAKSSISELKIEVIDSIYIPNQRPGMIIDQSPKPDMGVKSGRRVFVTINSFRPKMEVIPYVAGFSLRQAKNILETKGFVIDKLTYQPDMATNNVISQSWNGKPIRQGSNVEAELGSGVTLIVGRNPESPLPVIPKVIGLTLREAKSRLWEIGLNIGDIKNDPDVTATNIDEARIYKQSPNQQMRADYGGRISLWLTTDNVRISEYSKESDAQARREAKDDAALSEDERMMKELGISNE